MRERLIRATQAALLAPDGSPPTVRSVAREVGVSHSLVNYHFGSLDGLIARALLLQVAPHDVIRAAAGKDAELDLGRLIHGLLTVWEHPSLGARFRDLARRAASGEPQSRALVAYLERTVVDPLEQALGRARAQQVTTVIAGVIFGRYVVRLDSLARAPVAEFERTVLTLLGPSMRRQRSGSA